jgi:Mn-dependent DtxR family transcriptional regulator
MHQTAIQFDTPRTLSTEALGASDRVVQRMRVLDAIRTAKDGLTTDELAAMWNVGQNALSGRMTELRKLGLIVTRGTRLTRAGCRASVHYESK